MRKPHARGRLQVEPSGYAMETLTLRSGGRCAAKTVSVPLARGYTVLVFPESQGQPSLDDQCEMLAISLRLARDISQQRFGNPDCYLLIHNGLGTRRRRNFHFHIIPVANRIEKTFVYLWLFAKNMLHPLWLLTRGLRRRNRVPQLPAAAADKSTVTSPR